MKKSVTLVELIMGIILLGVILLAATSFDLASRQFFKSSDFKSELLAEASFVMDHIDKHLSEITGYASDKGYNRASANTFWLRTASGTYEYRVAGNVLQFCDITAGGTCEVLTQKLSPIAGDPLLNASGISFSDNVTIDNNCAVEVKLSLLYRPGEAEHYKTNPRVTLWSRTALIQHSF